MNNNHHFNLGAGSDFIKLRAFLSISLVVPSSKGSFTDPQPRRVCFDVTITDDDTLENTESFSLLLQEDVFTSQTGAIINRNRTEIFILDEDGILIYFSNVSILQLLCSLNTCYLEQHELVCYNCPP